MKKIALGTAQFGMDYGISAQNFQVNNSEVSDILDFANSNGINFLDTAPTYGDSEKVLGNVGVNNFNLITKTRHFPKDSLNHNDISDFVRDFNNSLSFLKQKRIYGLLVHNAEDLLKPGSKKLFDQMRQLKKKGLVSKVGVSVYSSYQIHEIIKRFEVDIIQVPINILDRRLIDNGTIEILNIKGIEVHARSIFLQGLLLMDKESLPKKFNKWNSLWDVWHQWLNDNKISALEASIGFAMSLPEISKVLVGVNSMSQLKSILNCANFQLPELPESFYSDDLELLNPVNWKNL